MHSEKRRTLCTTYNICWTVCVAQPYIILCKSSAGDYVLPWFCPWYATQSWTLQPNGQRSIKKWEGNQAANKANSLKCLTSCLETFASPQGLTDPEWPESAHWSVSPLQRSAACWECVVVFVFLLTLRGAYGSQHKASTQLLSTLILSHSSLQRWTTGHSGMHEHTHMAFKAHPPLFIAPSCCSHPFIFRSGSFTQSRQQLEDWPSEGGSMTERTGAERHINFCLKTHPMHTYVYMQNI